MIPNDWERKSIGEVLTIGNGRDYKHLEKGDIPVYGSGGYMTSVSEFLYEGESVCIGRKGTIDSPMFLTGKFWTVDTLFYSHSFKNVIPKFIYYHYLMINWRGYNEASGVPSLSKSTISQIPILIPPIQEQKKIALILSTWDKAIETVEKLVANSQQQKKALMQQLLTGQKRLLDENGVKFGGEWNFLKFDNVFKVANNKSTKIKNSDYLESGSIPIVDQGQSLIAGYCESSNTYTDIPVIIFGDHTRCVKWVDFDFCMGADGTQVLKVQSSIYPKFGFYILSFVDIPNLGYSRHMRELKEKEFKIPSSIHEQKKIAQVLTLADREIDLYQRQLDKLKLEKKALMQQLLTGQKRVKLDS